MLIYRDRKHNQRLGPPTWLEDAQDVQQREDAAGRLWAIGEPALVGPRPEGEWRDLGNQWDCCVIGKLDTKPLRRRQLWASLFPSHGVDEIIWMAPEILTPTGEMAIRPPLGGADFLPMPTYSQRRCLDVATAARSALIQASTGGDGLPLSAACRWAAVLLSETHHVPPEVFGCGLMDEILACQVNRVAAGFRPVEAPWA